MIIYYTGQGQVGDQKLSSANKTLAESQTNGIRVVLFEVFEKYQYTYRGDVSLANDPFLEEQFDTNGDYRNVFIFPLKLIDAQGHLLPKEIYENTKVKKRKRIKTLSDDELDKRLTLSENEKPGYTYVKVKNYQRSDAVIEKVLRCAKGICELCKSPAPFIKTDKSAYLEVHHIDQLAKGGADTVENAVALCPNCHRKMHSLDLETDRQILLSIHNK